MSALLNKWTQKNNETSQKPFFGLKAFCDSIPVILQVKSFDALVGLLTCSVFITPSQLL